MAGAELIASRRLLQALDRLRDRATARLAVVGDFGNALALRFARTHPVKM
jgi:hypothetical protein